MKLNVSTILLLLMVGVMVMLVGCSTPSKVVLIAPQEMLVTPTNTLIVLPSKPYGWPIEMGTNGPITFRPDSVGMWISTNGVRKLRDAGLLP